MGQLNLPSPNAQRVLVVDDSADTAELLRIVVERAGYVPRIASSARDALAAAPEFRPHVALIDIGLPDMDGYKLTKLLRAQPELQSCRFIAVTGHTSPSAVARSIAAGFEAHLSKPVTADVLLAVIAQRGESDDTVS
ncbi:MAG TPA: response regulator [Polyangiaceae bacterium]|jgi:CheY-like chemotaxis protein